MAFRWVVVAVAVAEAQEVGTGGFEPFGVATDDEVGDVILCKRMVEIDEDPDTSKASEVIGGLHQNW
jgi:hypothetical protein